MKKIILGTSDAWSTSRLSQNKLQAKKYNKYKIKYFFRSLQILLWKPGNDTDIGRIFALQRLSHKWERKGLWRQQRRPCYKVVPNYKNPPKIKFLKDVKLTYHSYVCNSLTNFPYKTHAFNDWKRKLCPSAETCLEKNPWNHNLQVNLFSADFSHLEPLCRGEPSWVGAHTKRAQ